MAAYDHWPLGLVLAGCTGDDGDSGFVSDAGELTGDQQNDIEDFLGAELPASVIAEDTSAEFIAGLADAETSTVYLFVFEL